MTKITVETTVNVPAEKAWTCWNTPECINAWSTGHPDWHTKDAQVDLREGGSFSSRMEAKDGSAGFDFGGSFTKVVPNKQLEYTMDDGRTVQISFEDQGGKTRIVETFDAETENSDEMQRQGWQGILDNFKAHVESH